MELVKTKKFPCFFLNCAQFLKCLSWSCPIPGNCPNQSRSKTRCHSSGVCVAVSSATLTPSPTNPTISRNAMWKRSMATDNQLVRGLGGSGPALLSQPKAVRPGCDHRVALCLTKWFSHFSQFFGHYVNPKYLMLVGRWGTLVPPFCRQQPPWALPFCRCPHTIL